MDRSRLIISAIDELRQIRSDTRSCSSLDTIRRFYERLQEIRRAHVDDFDLQIIIADAQQEVIERARVLRKEGEPGFKAAIPPVDVPPPPEPYETDAAEIPPDIPKLDHKSWRLAVGLAILFTVGICGSFFYLIQMARRLNFSTATTPTQPVTAPAATAAKPKPVVQIAAPAVSMTPTLRLYTDLIGGTATLDDQPPKDLTDGELDLDSISPGSHSLRVEGRSGSAAFTFSVDDDKDVPHVTAILKSTNAMLVLVSVKDGVGNLSTDAAGAQVNLDEKPAGTVGPAGVLLSELGSTDHNLDVIQGRDHQKFVLSYTPAPTLTVFVKSDPSTGVLTVSTGLDGVFVFINDLPYKRPTEHGEVRIPLKVGTYRIRVHKDGFTDPAIAIVDVQKSAEASVLFHLSPEPQLASLQIKGAQPGTVAYIDRQVEATVGADGNAKIPNIKPGVHIIELHHDQALPKELGRTFEAGQTITLTGADVALDHLAADNKTVIPGSAMLPPPVVPQLEPTTVTSPLEQVHKGGGFIPYSAPHVPGRYYFQAHTKLGGLLKHGKLQWYAGYQNSQNYVLYTLDGKHAEVKQVRDGKTTDVGKIPFSLSSDEWVQVEVNVQADTLEARAKNGLGEWVPLTPVSTAGQDFTQDNVGLYVPQNDEVAVANFRFTGH